MAVRNCADIGANLQLIMDRLMDNDKLVNLLYYTDQDPLNHTPLTDNEKIEKIFNKLIRIVPHINAEELTTQIVSFTVIEGTQTKDNDEFRDLTVQIEVFTPWDQWLIKDENLRPFATLGAIQESLNHKRIKGLGTMEGGDFSLAYSTKETSCYQAIYNLTTYE